MNSVVQAPDLLIKTSEQAWAPYIDGIEIKVLRTCDVTGTWTVLFHCQKGSSIPRHRHYGPGEYYVVRGRMEYRAGVAVTGDYGYEPLDAVHEKTTFTEETELYFTNFGPVLFLDDNDEVVAVLDHSRIAKLAAG